jgi:hypothetical protein
VNVRAKALVSLGEAIQVDYLVTGDREDAGFQTVVSGLGEALQTAHGYALDGFRCEVRPADYAEADTVVQVYCEDEQ